MLTLKLFVYIVVIFFVSLFILGCFAYLIFFVGFYLFDAVN